MEKLKQTPDILIVMIFEILHEKLKRIRLVLFMPADLREKNWSSSLVVLGKVKGRLNI